ncbi:hypothetical protein [Pseudomonas mosselii]|uniref:hypothetical protein n=1 Tax=Pseudomonas mosselii TaxID=78327 RepID=UPI0011B3630E|nr:hypothetical protein [Pseudomonas mosselii]
MDICFAITDADFGLTKDVFGLAFSGIAAVAGLLAACAAIRGVNTWRKQLRGQADYQLAEEMLIAIYKYQELLEVSWQVAEHAVHKIESDGWMGGEDNGLPESYFTHWLCEMKKVRSEFDLTATKCAALWRGNFKGGFKWLHHFEYYCSNAISTCVELYDGSGYKPEKEYEADRVSASWLALGNKINSIDKDPNSYLARLFLPLVTDLDEKRNVRN